jgi:hypothetical protein
MADVVFPHRAKQRIANGVHEHVGVRMTFEPLSKFDFHPSKNQLSAFHKPVDIVSDPYVSD